MGGRLLAFVVFVVIVAVAGCASPGSKDRAGPPPEMRSAQAQAAIDASLSVAGAALAAGQLDAAERLYGAIAQAPSSSGAPPVPRAWIGLARVAHARGDTTLAAQRFSDAIARARYVPRVRATAHLGLARLALEVGDLVGAEREAVAGLETVPDDPWLVNLRAVVASRRGAHALALGHHEALSGAVPALVDANRIRVLIEAGRFEDARARLADVAPDLYPPDVYAALEVRLDELDGLDSSIGGSRRAVVALGASGRLCLRHPLLPDDCDPSVDALARRPFVRRLLPLPPEGAPVRLEVGTSALVDLPAPPVDVVLDQFAPASGDGSDASVSSVLKAHLFDEQLNLVALSPGRATLTVLDAYGFRHVRVVQVDPNLMLLREAFERDSSLSGVEVEPLMHGALLSGSVTTLEAAARARRLASFVVTSGAPIESAIRIEGAQQVRLEVQIAEVARSVSERLGISWELFFRSGSDRLGMRYGVLPSLGDGQTSPNLSGPGAFVSGLGSSLGAFGGRIGGDGSARLLLDALSQAGFANILARPILMAASGEEASFYSGADYPFVKGLDDLGKPITDYRAVGILLEFTPTVLSPDRIALRVAPEVSDIEIASGVEVGGAVAPSFPTRKAQTVVEVGDGESLVIAGLYRQNASTKELGVPGLKDLPAIGGLFTSTERRLAETELLVMVTARLVDARVPEDHRAPVYRVTPDGYYY